MQNLTSVSNTGLCDAALKLKDPFKTYLLGCMIKAAQPQRSSERKGWREKLKQYLARYLAPGEPQPPCPGVKPIKPSQHYHGFWLRGWLPMGHSTHDGMKGKSQLRHLYITVHSTSNSNVTVQFDSFTIRIGETGMKTAASDKLTAGIFTCKSVNTNSLSTEISGPSLQLQKDCSQTTAMGALQHSAYASCSSETSSLLPAHFREMLVPKLFLSP